MRLIDRKKAVMRYLMGAGIYDATWVHPNAAVVTFRGWRMRVEGGRVMGGNKTVGQVLKEMAEGGVKPALIRVVEREMENAHVTIRFENYLEMLATIDMLERRDK